MRRGRTGLPAFFRVGQLGGGREGDLLGGELSRHVVRCVAVLAGQGESKDAEEEGNHEATDGEDSVKGSASHFVPPNVV